MSANWPSNSGSVLNLKVSTRWGCSPYLHQIQCTVMKLTPISLANRRALQWVAAGGRRLVAVTTANSLARVVLRGRPLPRRPLQPPTPPSSHPPPPPPPLRPPPPTPSSL